MRFETNMDKVRDFHEAFGHPIDGQWTKELVRLRRNLIDEEYMEADDEFEEIYYKASHHEEITVDNKEKLTKELVDILYVVYGAGVALGLNLDRAFDIVHQSNMSKLGEDGKPILREDGKVLKGPNYREANLKELFGKE